MSNTSPNTNARRSGLRWGVLVVLGSLLALAAAAHAARPTSAALSKLDPRLLAARTDTCLSPELVWVQFADKGEQGPADLAARLAAAQASLTPRALARRQRNHVSPLVDYFDLPVHQPYVDTLVAHGYHPFAATRWFNRVAIHECSPLVEALAELPFVSRIEPVERLQRVGDPAAAAADAVTRRARPDGALAATSLNYGFTRAQLQQMNVPAVHDSGYIGAGVMIAVLDEGFNSFDTHDALRTLDVGGRTRDFVDGDSNVQNPAAASVYRHGTWCLSAIGGNSPGAYVGPAFGASFALARTENSYNEKPIEMVTWGLGAEWADSLGADIVSSSVGYATFPDSVGNDLMVSQLNGHTSHISQAAQIAASRGMLLVNSAGNYGGVSSWNFRIVFPADVNGDSLLAVAAVDSNGVRQGFSSTGPTADGRTKPDLAARGSRTWLAEPGANPSLYGMHDGTSFSCPLVAGLAACLMQARPNWPAVWIAEALKRTASRASSPDNLYGWGIPNGLAALRYVPDTAGVPAPGVGIALHLLGPNPLRRGGPDARLRFGLGTDRAAFGQLRVFDAQGRRVRTLWSGTLVPGVAVSASWNGRDDSDRATPPGVYFARLDAAGRSATARIASLR